MSFKSLAFSAAMAFTMAGCPSPFKAYEQECLPFEQCQSVNAEIAYEEQPEQKEAEEAEAKVLAELSKAAAAEGNIIISSLENRLSFYAKNKSPEVNFKGHMEISLNNSYEKRKKEEVQDILGKAGFLVERDAIGCFDKVTVDALKKFQKKNNSLQDGKVGSSTVKALNKVAKFELNTDKYKLLPDTICALNSDDIRLIEEIQSALNFHNYLLKEPNGKLDDETVEAIRKYKRYNAINNRDAIDRTFARHISLPSSYRIEMLKEALAAIKSLELSSSNNIYVNIPEFRMRYFKNDKLAISLDVIVGNAKGIKNGKHRWETSIQEGIIKYVTVNPWWKVPPGDLTEEVREDLKKSVSLRNVMEQLVEGEWKIIEDDVQGLRFRQIPGPSNPLGRVAYYLGTGTGEMLHGTSNRRLFKNNVRAFSHGCMRLSDEIALFRKFQELEIIVSGINLDELLSKKDSKGLYESSDVSLSQPVKVNVIYLRAFAEESENGIFMTMPSDIYNYKKSRAK